MTEVVEKLFVTPIFGPIRRWCTATTICEHRGDYVGPLRQPSGGPECTAYCQDCLPDYACVKQDEEPEEEEDA